MVLNSCQGVAMLLPRFSEWFLSHFYAAARVSLCRCLGALSLIIQVSDFEPPNSNTEGSIAHRYNCNLLLNVGNKLTWHVVLLIFKKSAYVLVSQI